MSEQRGKYLDELKEWLIRLERSIEADKILLHQDSFDLCDKTNSLAVQVTRTTSANKIRDTLKSFIGTHDRKYKRLVFIYPRLTLGKIRANFDKDIKGYNFDPNRDRLCLGSVLEKAQNMRIEEQERLLDLVRSELKPIGQALQMGVDQTVEILITVIEYMSKNAPLDAVDLNETRPDQQQKLERLREHARYLLDQYRINQPLHAPMDKAREAIGYDTVRAAKIQAWLKSHSLEMLDTHTNDAKMAFKAMVDDLLQRAHSRGTDAEETAVRFLLADEFTRCNVFPNPVVN